MKRAFISAAVTVFAGVQLVAATSAGAVPASCSTSVTSHSRPRAATLIPTETSMQVPFCNAATEDRIWLRNR